MAGARRLDGVEQGSQLGVATRQGERGPFVSRVR
jgi:hypothetical protein